MENIIIMFCECWRSQAGINQINGLFYFKITHKDTYRFILITRNGQDTRKPMSPVVLKHRDTRYSILQIIVSRYKIHDIIVSNTQLYVVVCK